MGIVKYLGRFKSKLNGRFMNAFHESETNDGPSRSLRTISLRNKMNLEDLHYKDCNELLQYEFDNYYDCMLLNDEQSNELEEIADLEGKNLSMIVSQIKANT